MVGSDTGASPPVGWRLSPVDATPDAVAGAVESDPEGGGRPEGGEALPPPVVVTGSVPARRHERSGFVHDFNGEIAHLERRVHLAAERLRLGEAG